MVWSEGSLERDYIRLLEFDHQVTGYLEQPVLVRYRYWENGDIQLVNQDGHRDETMVAPPPGGKLARYYPDFFVERENRPPLLVEVKQRRLLDDDVVKRKLTAGKLLAQDRGWEFCCVTEEIRTGPILTNVRILQRYSHVRVPSPVQVLAQETIALTAGPLSVEHLAKILGVSDHRVAQAYVYALVHSGMLVVDLGAEVIGPQSVISLKRGRIGG